MWEFRPTNELYHYGVKGMRWGVRRYQNKDGTLTTAGRKRKNLGTTVKKRYDERYDIYVSSADYIINCTNDVNENVENIKEVIFGENFSD